MQPGFFIATALFQSHTLVTKVISRGHRQLYRQHELHDKKDLQYLQDLVLRGQPCPAVPAIQDAYGPDNCIRVLVSAQGTCRLKTDCPTQNISDIEFQFVCFNPKSYDMPSALHSFGRGGFDRQEDFDSGVPCQLCTSVPFALTSGGPLLGRTKELVQGQAEERAQSPTPHPAPLPLQPSPAAPQPQPQPQPQAHGPPSHQANWMRQPDAHEQWHVQPQVGMPSQYLPGQQQQQPEPVRQHPVQPQQLPQQEPQPQFQPQQQQQQQQQLQPQQQQWQAPFRPSAQEQQQQQWQQQPWQQQQQPWQPPFPEQMAQPPMQQQPQQPPPGARPEDYAEEDAYPPEYAAYFGPQACIAAFRTAAGTCTIETRCKQVNISDLAVGITCVDKVGGYTRYLFERNSFGREERFDTRLRCEACLGVSQDETSNGLKMLLPKGLVADVNRLRKEVQGLRSEAQYQPPLPGGPVQFQPQAMPAGMTPTGMPPSPQIGSPAAFLSAVRGHGVQAPPPPADQQQEWQEEPGLQRWQRLQPLQEAQVQQMEAHSPQYQQQVQQPSVTTFLRQFAALL